MTNADYIRQKMSDEYIAQEFCGIAAPFNEDCDNCPHCGSFEERLKWLKAEYYGETETEIEYSDFCDKNAENLSELQEIRDILSDLIKRIEKMEEKLS